MLVDYHVHALAHGEYEADQAWLNAYVDQACRRGIKEMGFSEHDEFIAGLDRDTFRQVQNDRRQDLNLRLGIEIDYLPGGEEDILRKFSQADYDYWIGSVHFIDGWAFDHPAYRQGFDEQDIDEIYARMRKFCSTGFPAACLTWWGISIWSRSGDTGRGKRQLLTICDQCCR